uniref:Fibronectin type-III domain-containing protein n=1 Tax=Maylandia zebra TaxID=106582 RepID=A0A3P9AUN2_9CICH
MSHDSDVSECAVSDNSCVQINNGSHIDCGREYERGEVVVAPAQIGSTHSWKWTSHLPSQCARHSVRLRRRYLGEILVLPRDQILEVGSTATFCCMVPDGESIKTMFLYDYKGTNVTTTKISEHVHSLTVHLDQESENYSDVRCETTKGNINGASFHASYPPDDSDLKCETRDLESIDCFWNVGRAANEHPAMERTYQLQGRYNKTQPPLIYLQSPVWKHLRVNISLKWSWTVQKYSNLNITCQVDVSDGNSNTKTENIEVGLTAAVIKDLIPHWDYVVRVRCGTAQHFWKWGDWSNSVKIRTKGDVPDALDVWMKVKADQAVISWKVSPSWLLQGFYEYVVKSNFKESFSDTSEVKTSWISGSNGSFFLSWPDSPNASCGYIYVLIFAYKTVADHICICFSTAPFVVPENFEDGRRYLLSIYACTEGAAVLLQRRKGYIRETKIGVELFKLKYKQEDSAVEVSWEPIPLEKQTASIHGYILYYQDKSGNVFNVSTADQLIMLILISLGAVFLILSVSTIICYRQWAW